MKKLILLLSMIHLHAFAQTVYLADTAFVTDIGYGGAPASCKANGLQYNSVNMDRIHSVWVADKFTVPIGSSWVFDSVIVFGYQYGSGLSSPFTGCNLQIYNGTPGSGGIIVWGDTVTNVLSSTSFTGIYKVDTFTSSGGLMSNNRPIMYLNLHLSPPVHLNAGTYWLSWSATCSTSSSSATTPFKVLPGRINPSGQVAKAYINNSWINVVDNGNNVGLNMIIKAKAGLDIEPLQGVVNALHQNMPNPFKSVTTIPYILTENCYVKLDVYNVLSQKVASLVDCYMSKGEHEVSFSADNLPGGTYYYKLSSYRGTICKQMILFK